MLGLLILLTVAFVLLLSLLAIMLAYEMRHPPRHTAGYAVAKGLACDPGERGLAFEEWRLDRPDGASLAVWEVHPKSRIQNPGALTAVFVHGWGHGRIDSLARVDIAAPHCDRVVLYDLRGHGESTGLSNLGQGETDDLLALLERLDAAHYWLIGHSMGAVIAIKAAADAVRNDAPIARRIAGIVAYGAYAEFHDSLRGRLRVAGYPARPITDLALLLHRAAGIRPLSLRETDIAAVRCPVLMIHGCDDQVAPLHHARRLSNAAKCTLHEIIGGAHTDLHQINPAEHDRVLREFVESKLRQADGASSPAATR